MFDKKYISPSEALKIVLGAVSGPLAAEKIRIEDCLGRVAAEDVYAGEDLPGFARSSVDGFAVRASDTYGAKETFPAYIISNDEVLMGEKPAFTVKKGVAARIPTGGMLPDGADAVVMIENVQVSSGAMIEILKQVAFGENVIQADEDVKSGVLIISRGRELRPQDTGALAGLGFSEIVVVRKPVVSMISTGDEVMPHSSRIKPGQVRDINSFTLAGLISEEGGIPLKKGIIKDDYASIRDALESAVRESDIVLIIGGTSVGTRDMTAKIISDVGLSELLFHGVAVKPGKPLIGGMVDSVPVLGLPGHPAAVAICFNIFIKPLINKLCGIDVTKLFQRKLTAVMAKSVASTAGREDHVRVKIESGENGYVAVPVLGKSGLIMTLVRADGVVVIPENKLGLDAGETVEVNLF